MNALQTLVNDAEVLPVHDVPGLEPDDDIPLYAPRRKIYPQSVHGA